uniref:Uncharacterized protein n=1 Tax=Anguilla anguilla TaxID=7936 RepID=A0A0E9T6U4_ANGAN
MASQEILICQVCSIAYLLQRELWSLLLLFVSIRIRVVLIKVEGAIMRLCI